MKAFKGNIVTEHEVVNGYMVVDGGKVASVTTEKPACEVADYGDSYFVPGFIDMHIHGLHEYLIDDGPEAYGNVCKTLPKYGVTSFLPTVSPLPAGQDTAYLASLAATETEGANVLGFHLEGPFLKLTGAFNSDAITGANEDRARSLITAAKPYKAIFSIAPDVEGVDQWIPIMAADNTPVFITHTAANVEQTQKAIAAGACHATHFYDVFPCPPVTEPGVRPCGAVEAILADPGVSVDFILDGVHVNPIAVKMALQCKPEKVCLITDANIGAGLEPGVFNFGNMGPIYFEYKGAPARGVDKNDLNGSGLTLDQALRNAIKFLGIDIVAASHMLSRNPANVIRVGDHKGLLAAGYDADFVILDKENLEVQQTWISGKEYYNINK